jgi:hypothetical protein
MSEMTLITKRYGDIVDFTSKVNKSVIVLKKKSLLGEAINRLKYPKLQVNDVEVKDAKESLLQSLTNLETLAADTEYNNKLMGVSESSALHIFVIKNEVDKREIEAIVHSIKDDVPLSKSNFLMLDKIIAILDSERSMLFKKLRTVRG